jgi:hexulose-6-phosphate isomerase
VLSGRPALGAIGYDGWATSEVSGGGEAELADIAARMKRVLGPMPLI